MNKKYLLLLTMHISLMAVDQNWCGNKHKNLVILRDMLKNEQDVEIPAFIGISTGRVESFIRNHNPEIMEMYASLTEKLNKKFSFRHPILSLQKTLKRIFTKNPYYHQYDMYDLVRLIQSSIESLFLDYEFLFTEDELHFFDDIDKKQHFLMVRSTGVEDNSNVANAGGNLSLAYISSTKKAVSEAMGRVVASYFGVQSLKNRIAGGEYLLADELIVPVLIQELVGEQLGGAVQETDIPVSGVAYTTNKNFSDTNFSITEIDASYGHGEGIVANLVKADRYYMMPSRAQQNIISIYPMIYEKRERLVPAINTHTLVSIENSTTMMHKSSLSEQYLTRFFHVLKKIESHYGSAMDVEFIFKQGKIYIVQARPAMYKSASPSYINIESIPAGNIGDVISSTILVAGIGRLLVISNPQDIIITKTLDEADQHPDSYRVKAVIVDTWASSLSHPAVNFMSYGTPCMHVSNIAVVTKLVSSISEDNPLVIDPQRGRIFLWKNSNTSPDNYQISGWFEHPIERKLSLFMNNAPLLKPFFNPIPKDAVVMRYMFNLKTEKDKAKKRELLEELNKRVVTFLDLASRRSKNIGYTFNTQTAEAFNLFKTRYTNIINEITHALDTGASDFEFLFYHKMLEAYLYQTYDSSLLLAGYTYNYFLNEIFEKQLIQKILMNKKIIHTKELEYAHYAPSSDLSDKWILFITQLDVYLAQAPLDFKEKTIKFDAFIHEIEKLESLSLWFATYFYQKVQNKNITPDLMQYIIADIADQYTSESEKFLRDVVIYQHALGRLIDQDQPYKSLSQAEMYWETVKNDLLNPLISEDFIVCFQGSKEALKLIVCNIMKEVVDVIDSAIKKVKISTTILEEDRIHMFKSMLTDFKMLSVTWLERIMPETSLQYHYGWPLRTYIGDLNMLFTSIMSASNTSDMFKKSSSFSVNAAVLGSGTAFNRHYPQTAEDIFMLIHQNALTAISGTMHSILNASSLQEVIAVPTLFASYAQTFETNNEIKINRIGISYEADRIVLFYNIPLNNHSATAQLIYDMRAQEYSYMVQFVGEARDRWVKIAALANISYELSELSLIGSVHFDQNAGIVSWQWSIKSLSDALFIIKYLKIMAHISFQSYLDTRHLKELYRGVLLSNDQLQRKLDNLRNKVLVQ